MIKLYESNKYGLFEIMDNSNRMAIKVRFVDSGYETTASRSNVNAGKVCDHGRKKKRTDARKRAYYLKKLELDKAVRALNAVERKPPDDMRTGCVHKTKGRGLVRVVEYRKAVDIEIEFIDTGYRCISNSSALRRGADLRDPLAISVFGVGRIGIGPHAAHSKGKDTQEFQIWRAMLRRCYYKRPDGTTKWATYYGIVTVCHEWLTFQTFAKWYKDNHPNDGATYDLDKDILIRGNKVYGPDACKFVTRGENARVKGSYRTKKVLHGLYE